MATRVSVHDANSRGTGGSYDVTSPQRRMGPRSSNRLRKLPGIAVATRPLTQPVRCAVISRESSVGPNPTGQLSF